MTLLHLRTGFELELLAPAGLGRRDVAERIALDHGGEVRRTFHTDSEPSLVPGMGHFWHLTPGYAVHGADGALLATLVDDVTITADLRPGQAATGDGSTRRPHVDEHSYRVLSDDARLLRLVAERTSPDTPFARVLDDVAVLFGTSVETLGAVRRLRDRAGASVALATGLAEGRERPCEVVTPPLRRDHEAALEALLRPARELGCTIPVEAAVHLHVDAAPFRSAPALANLVRLFGHRRDTLRTVLGTNPACTRLQPLPPALVALVDQVPAGGAPATGDWPRLQAAASGTGLTKYFDVNLTAVLTDRPVRDTVEVRLLPGALHATEVTERAALVEGLLARCLEPEPLPHPVATDPAAAAAELLALARPAGRSTTGRAS